MNVEVNNTFIRNIDDYQWTVKTENISVTYKFDEINGISISSFKNLATNPAIEYVQNPYSIIPINAVKKAGNMNLSTQALMKMLTVLQR